MNFRERGTTSILILMAALLLLPLLAILQYRWLAQLSERESEHMKANLRATAARFCQEFDDELTRIYAAFSPTPDLWSASGRPDRKDRPGRNDDWLSNYAARYDRWLADAQYPRMIKDILIAKTDGKGSWQLHKLQAGTKQFIPADWPAELSALRQQLEQAPTDGQRIFIRELMGRRLQMINDETMVLLHPILIPPAFGARGEVALEPPSGVAIVTLSIPEIRNEIFPALMKRHFSDQGFEYSAEVVAQAPEEKLIYRFGPPSAKHAKADVTVGLMGLRREEIRRLMNRFQPAGGSPIPRPEMPGVRDGQTRIARQQRPPIFPRGGVLGLPPPNEESKLWQLRLTHRAGSLEAAVASIRRRNLMISFSILVLLAASVLMMMVSARRAHRLARQQMDFVTSVSHELRTPLAVIKSAAWNLTRGVIRDPEQVKRYSTLIGKESDRLIDMIEQVLEFAGAQSGHQKFDLQPVNIHELIEDVLASALPIVAEKNYQIEKDIDPDLPQVAADGPALARALRNLIDNAMKYSGDNRWIGIEAHSSNGVKPEVRITIRDRGMGIPAGELKNIFDPFWRGSQVTAAQIHGSGLGLHLVKKIVTAHGGSITVKSVPGDGSAFTLSLPAIAHPSPEPASAELGTPAAG